MPEQLFVSSQVKIHGSGQPIFEIEIPASSPNQGKHCLQGVVEAIVKVRQETSNFFNGELAKQAKIEEPVHNS